MHKILIQIYLPANDCVYEMRVPKQLKIREVLNMLEPFLQRHANEGFIPHEDMILCDMDNGRTLDSNEFVERSGLHNGSKVMVI